MNNSWRLLLWSVFYGGSDYGYTALHPKDRAIASIIEQNKRSDLTDIQNENNPEWIMGEAGTRYFFGRWGLVGDFLEWDHPAARDSVGRKREFFLGYSAVKGSKLPRVVDLSDIDKLVKADLAQLWQQVRTSGRTTVDPPFRTFFFNNTTTNGLWDKAAEALENQQSFGVVIYDRSGNSRRVSAPIEKGSLSRVTPQDPDSGQFTSLQLPLDERSNSCLPAVVSNRSNHASSEFGRDRRLEIEGQPNHTGWSEDYYPPRIKISRWKIFLGDTVKKLNGIKRK